MGLSRLVDWDCGCGESLAGFLNPSAGVDSHPHSVLKPVKRAVHDRQAAEVHLLGDQDAEGDDGVGLADQDREGRFALVNEL